eukprot:jgi/Chrzof1/4413/Cz14g12070.t1
MATTQAEPGTAAVGAGNTGSAAAGSTANPPTAGNAAASATVGGARKLQQVSTFTTPGGRAFAGIGDGQTSQWSGSINGQPVTGGVPNIEPITFQPIYFPDINAQNFPAVTIAQAPAEATAAPVTTTATATTAGVPSVQTSTAGPSATGVAVVSITCDSLQPLAMFMMNATAAAATPAP